MCAAGVDELGPDLVSAAGGLLTDGQGVDLKRRRSARNGHDERALAVAEGKVVGRASDVEEGDFSGSNDEVFRQAGAVGHRELNGRRRGGICANAELQAVSGDEQRLALLGMDISQVGRALHDVAVAVDQVRCSRRRLQIGRRSTR